MPAAQRRQRRAVRCPQTLCVLHFLCALLSSTMAAEAPGAAFLQRRLARAQAVPPAERSPEVQAFITSVELGRQICELLPLRAAAATRRPPRPAAPRPRHRPQARTRTTITALLYVPQPDRTPKQASSTVSPPPVCLVAQILFFPRPCGPPGGLSSYCSIQTGVKPASQPLPPSWQCPCIVTAAPAQGAHCTSQAASGRVPVPLHAGLPE